MDTSNLAQQQKTWENFGFHALITKCLYENNFNAPTDVQSHVLPYTKYKLDMIIASKTGSGKTLCFGIPMLSELMTYLSIPEDLDPNSELKFKREHIYGLILTPTRELAVQIKRHLDVINAFTKKYIKIGVIIGGISKEKQERILSYKPQIVIGTPGRLWDMLDEEGNDYLRTLKKIRYLVLDEADKMVEAGHFKEVDKILGYIYGKDTVMQDNLEHLKKYEAKDFLNDFFIKDGGSIKVLGKDIKVTEGGDVNQSDGGDNRNSDDNRNDYCLNDEAGDNQQADIEGSETLDHNDEAESLNEEERVPEADLDNNAEDEKDRQDDYESIPYYIPPSDSDSDPETSDDRKKMRKKSPSKLRQGSENNLTSDNDDDGGSESPVRLRDKPRNKHSYSKKSKQKQEKTNIRTIVLSATLAKSDHLKKRHHQKASRKQKSDSDPETKVKGLERQNLKIETLFSKIHFNGTPKLIDLTSQTILPETLKQFKSLCSDEDKVIYLYYYLKNRIGESHIIFTNTIPAAKRVASLLNLLNLKSLCLHSEMQQRQRLKKLEQFYNKASSIIVCTDVASRGLDIPSVQNIIHFQIPRDVDTYVHRCGRTARIGNQGVAYALVGPGEKKSYLNICRHLNMDQGIHDIGLSYHELSEFKELASVADKLEKGEFQLKKKKKEKEWFLQQAKKADLELDDTIKMELDNMEEEMTTKKKIVLDDKSRYKKAQKRVDKYSEAHKRRSVFLDPAKVAELNGILARGLVSAKGTGIERTGQEGRGRSKSRGARESYGGMKKGKFKKRKRYM